MDIDVSVFIAVAVLIGGLTYLISSISMNIGRISVASAPAPIVPPQPARRRKTRKRQGVLQMKPNSHDHSVSLLEPRR
jgi:hypothetical protein